MAQSAARGGLRTRIRRRARAFPSASAAQLAAWLNCHPDTVRRHLRGLRPSHPLLPNTKAPANDSRATTAAWCAHLSRDPDRRTRRLAAGHAANPPQVLARLALDPYWWVRQTAAKNPNCPQATLRRLSRDRSLYVRAAIAALEACPARELVLLAGDPDTMVRQYVADNRRCPRAVLERLAGDRESSVRRRAAVQLSTPFGASRSARRDPGG